MEWTRIEPGKYQGIDPQGGRWIIWQAATSRWDIYRNGEYVEPFAPSLRDAKVYVADDVRERMDPALHARREARRQTRRERGVIE